MPPLTRRSTRQATKKSLNKSFIRKTAWKQRAKTTRTEPIPLKVPTQEQLYLGQEANLGRIYRLQRKLKDLLETVSFLQERVEDLEEERRRALNLTPPRELTSPAVFNSPPQSPERPIALHPGAGISLPPNYEEFVQQIHRSIDNDLN